MSNMYKESVGSNSLNSSTNGYDDHNVVDIMCLCGFGSCKILVSKSQKNANRKFYTCPRVGPMGCKFFKWCDELLITCPLPSCPCGAGLCCVIIEQQKHTPLFFVCPINKGQGACNFKQSADATIYSKWEDCIRSITDSSPKSTLTHCFFGEISPSSISTSSDKTTVEDESSDISFQLPESKSSVTLNPQQRLHSHNFETNVLPLVDKMPTVMSFQEQQDDNPEEDEEPFFPKNDRHRKRMRHEDSKTDDVSIYDWDSDRNFDILAAKFEEVSFTDTFANQASHSGLSADEEFFAHQQQHSAEIPCKSFSAAGPTTLPRGVFPSFGPIFVPGDDNRDGTESSSLTDNCGQQLGDGITKVEPTAGSDEPLLHQISQRNNSNNNIMKESILDVFKQAASRIEEGLISLLESMEPHEHKSMIREAHLVFKAFDNLAAVDYQSFKERVMGFIESAVSLSELESSAISSTEHFVEQEAMNKYNRMQKELKDKSGLCAEASVALAASNDHLNFLIQEEARIKEMLYNVQAEMFCCQVENEEINCGFNKMTADINKLENHVKVAKEEVEQARRLRQQREAQRDVAKGSFEQAWSKLRNGVSRMSNMC